MRAALLVYVGWLGALRSIGLQTPPTLDNGVRLLAGASVLGTLTVLVYNLGVWRQEMENTRGNVAAEVKAHREESASNFDRMERRLEAIDYLASISSEHRARTARWQTRTDRRLDRLEANMEAHVEANTEAITDAEHTQ